MLWRAAAVIALLTIAAPALALPKPKAGQVRVSLVTDAGTITLDLEAKKAPITTANFLRYIDEHRFDGTVFYRAARVKNMPKRGFIQGGIQHSYTRMLPAIAHEPTDKTGVHHLDGTISMARNAPGTAMGDFTILLGPNPAMDAHPGAKGDNAGFAAFGHVVAGMDVVREILAGATLPNAGSGPMKGEMLAKPITITAAHRG